MYAIGGECDGYNSRTRHTVFITSARYFGDMGGLSGADTICQNAATAAGLSGTWKAILSDSTTSAESRLNFNGGIIYNNAATPAIIANDKADLFDGTIANEIE